MVGRWDGSDWGTHGFLAPYMWDMGPRIFRWRFLTEKLLRSLEMRSLLGKQQAQLKMWAFPNRGASNHPSFLVILFGRKPWVKRAIPIFGNPHIFGHLNQEECGSV